MKTNSKITVSFVIPCLNEEKAIGRCVDQIFNFPALPAGRQFSIFNKRIRKQVIVVDNGSTDNSNEVAKKAGAKVVLEPRKGYGRALRTGLEKAKGAYLIFADGDGTYDFSESNKILEKLIGIDPSTSLRAPLRYGLPHLRQDFDDGLSRIAQARNDPTSPRLAGLRGASTRYDLVIGSRIRGKIKKGAMPFWHRYLGTPVLNFLFSLFFRQKISDVNSGFRGLTKKAFEKLKLKATGMEFASEMIYKAKRLNLKIAEVPITYSARVGKSKLTPFRDAWRHLKFLLLFSPSFLFIIPGSLLSIVGFILLVWLLPGKQILLGKYFDIHTMIVAAFTVLTGFQIVFLGVFAKVFAFNFLEEKDSLTRKMLLNFSLERGILFGAVIFLMGLLGFFYVLYLWWQARFGELNAPRILIFSLTLMVLGVQMVFSSFFFGLIGREER